MALLRRVIGSVLRRIRLRQGRTLREVAEAAGVSLPYLSEVERGRKEASSEVLAAICRALGLRLADLLDEVRDELARSEPGRQPVTPSVPRTPVPARPRLPRTAGGTAGTVSAVGGSAHGRNRPVTGPRSRRLERPVSRANVLARRRSGG
jgi:transcriptional regulator with XRE-family HTH domain